MPGAAGYLAYEKLSKEDQEKATKVFPDNGRTDGWEKIERWAFPVDEDGNLIANKYIEPAYTLSGQKVEERWRKPFNKKKK